MYPSFVAKMPHTEENMANKPKIKTAGCAGWTEFKGGNYRVIRQKKCARDIFTEKERRLHASFILLRATKIPEPTSLHDSPTEMMV